jgi:hypothetical protein
MPHSHKSHNHSRMFVFQNLSPQQIRGFLRPDTTLLHVFFFSSSSPSSSTNHLQQQPSKVTCVDAKKAAELLAIGIGGYVKLYNVKVPTTEDGVALVTADSGVRAVRPPANQKENNDGSNDKIVAGLAAKNQAQQQPSRWNCLMCNWLNFSSTSAFHVRQVANKVPLLPTAFSNTCEVLLTPTTLGRALLALPVRTLIGRTAAGNVAKAGPRRSRNTRR